MVSSMNFSNQMSSKIIKVVLHLYIVFLWVADKSVRIVQSPSGRVEFLALVRRPGVGLPLMFIIPSTTQLAALLHSSDNQPQEEKVFPLNLHQLVFMCGSCGELVLQAI